MIDPVRCSLVADVAVARFPEQFLGVGEVFHRVPGVVVELDQGAVRAVEPLDTRFDSVDPLDARFGPVEGLDLTFSQIAVRRSLLGRRVIR